MHGLCMYKIHEISTIMHEYVCKKSQLSCTNYVCKKSQLSCMNYACRKCQMSCGYQVAKIQPYNPPIFTHEISNFILYDMCMRDDYHAHISHLSGIMKRHFFPSVCQRTHQQVCPHSVKATSGRIYPQCFNI